MKSNFSKIVKKYFGHLPQDDYPVLNTFKFVSIWLNFVLDQSQTSMRSLFKRLNVRGESLDISTFSKASKNRDPKIFHDLWYDLKKEVIKQSKAQPDELQLFPLDSTIVTLTSKLLWSQGINQVKLFSGINLVTGSPGGLFIHFGQGHDHKYGDKTIQHTPLNGVGVMDRGFFSLSKIAQLKQMDDRYFVLRIKKNVTLKMLENGNFLVGKGSEQIEVRVVMFSDIKEQTEFILVTNLPATGSGEISNEEIGEFYRMRWQIELFWKFLKMHLKLDNIITKNVNGIEIQIYSCLIAYLLLKLVNIPQEFGKSLLDKLRYLQAFMCEKISYVHWFKELVPN
jgi:IS4 transposase